MKPVILTVLRIYTDSKNVKSINLGLVEVVVRFY
jgi:hypothetical protein